MTARQLSLSDLLEEPTRPRTRGECALPERHEEGTPWRVCGWLSCRYHLALTVSRRGRLKLNDGLMDPDTAEFIADGSRPTCALDVSDNNPDGATLEQVGAYLGDLSRERARQIEQGAISLIRSGASPRWLDLLGLERVGGGDLSIRPVTGGEVVVKIARRVEPSRRNTTMSAAEGRRWSGGVDDGDLAPYSSALPWSALSRRKRLQRLRQSLGWKASALAPMIGVDRATVRNAETGRLGVESFNALSGAVLNALNLPADALDGDHLPPLADAIASANDPEGAGIAGHMRWDWLAAKPRLKSHERLELARRSRGLTGAQVATLISKGWLYYSQLENGITKQNQWFKEIFAERVLSIPLKS